MHPGTAPKFWRQGGGRLLPALLWPASLVVAQITRRRVARTGWHAPIPVICCGNAGVGGAGKTTLALDLATRLQARGLTPHFLTRGHGGHLRGPIRVNPAHHDATATGDEALLLAATAPTWLGADRAATARLAISAGASALILDDGLQNPTLVQTAPLLVIDGAVGFGNGHVLPAGPLREPVREAAARARAAILIGPDATGAAAMLPPHLQILRATLVPAPEIAALAGTTVVAFAGIARPSKFFDMLQAAGLRLAASLAFPDHHVFTAAELADIRAQAHRHGARIVTTPKDYVRLPTAARHGIEPIGVRLAWNHEPALNSLLTAVIPN
jgi:tetraacyldisaccharide 4'-kinase